MKIRQIAYSQIDDLSKELCVLLCMPCTVNHVGKHFSVNSVKILAAALRDIKACPYEGQGDPTRIQKL